MKRLLLFLLLSGAALAQGTASGNITAQGTTCGTTNACVVLSVVPTTGAATVNFSGTFSATLQFEGSTDGVTWASIQATPIGSTTAVTSATGTGTWRINAAGLYGVRVRCSTFASGTVAVKMNSGSGSASTGSGGGGSTGFDAITSGTNTTAAMVVDSGASLAATGTGTIDATSAASIGTAATTTNSAFSIPVVASTSGNQAAKTVSGFTLNPSTSAMLIPGALTAAGAINGSTVSAGTAPTTCGSATGCYGATAADVTGSNVAGQFYMRAALTGTKFLFNYGSGEVPMNVASGGTGLASGTSGGILGYTASGTLASSGALTVNVLTKGGGAGATPTNSLHTDDGTSSTYTGTGGIKAPAFTSTGTTAGFFDFPQGTTSAAVAPCNTATSICFQAPTAVTSYLLTLAGAAATGIPHYANSANVITETISAIDLSSADATGTMAAARMPALTGDVTNSAGSLATTVGKVNGIGIQRVTMVADWTCGTGGTVSSCTVAVIVGSTGTPLTITLPSVAASYHWQCDGVVGQATAATANNWNVLTATNAATNVEVTYLQQTAATAFTGGATTGSSSTSTVVIGPAWTLGGTATKMPFHVQGSIEGASASGTVISLQLVAPTVADLVTIYRGATCSVTPF